MTRYHIAVASREHVRRAEAGGFCQMCHGREAAVRRLSPGDGLIYYSPREGMRSGAAIKAFTALGYVAPGEIYRVAQTDSFRPQRRDVRYLPAEVAPIQPMLQRLSFSQQDANWGLMMRRGLFEITGDDFRAIALAMGVDVG
jgi:hypothetical protein